MMAVGTGLVGAPRAAHDDSAPHEAPRAAWFDFPWTAAVALVAIAVTALALRDRGAVDAIVSDHRTFAAPWRALTGPFVHATWAHLVRDVGLIALVGVAYERELGRRWPPLIALATALPAVAVLAHGATIYLGLSGVSHAVIAAALGLELRRRRGRARTYVAAVAAVALAELAYEVATGAPAFPMDLGPGIRQVPLAHLVGAIVGATIGLVPARATSR